LPKVAFFIVNKVEYVNTKIIQKGRLGSLFLPHNVENGPGHHGAFYLRGIEDYVRRDNVVGSRR
jgi:hypothetical protein